MFFTILDRRPSKPPSSFPKACLVRDNWDDFDFKTSFSLRVFDEVGEEHLLGTVKIGQFSMQKGEFQGYFILKIRLRVSSPKVHLR